MTPTETMELAVVDARNAVEIFTGGGLDAVLDGIEAKVRAIPLDPSTATGREEIRSVAYKVVRTKTTLDAEGKKLTEGWREATKKVNDERKRSLERLDALAEEVRRPLTEFENKERLRVLAHEKALDEISGLTTMVLAHPDMTADLLQEHLNDYVTMHAERNWEEFSMRATNMRENTVAVMNASIAKRRKYEADQAELADAEAKRVIEAAEAERARVAAEAERVRLENERIQQEAEDARKREEQARLAAEQRATDAEAARVAAEAKAEQDRIEAAKKAEDEKKAAAARAAEQLKAAKEKAARDAEAAAARERERIAAENKAKEEARLRREADEANRAKIRAEIMEDLTQPLGTIALGSSIASELADAIMDGKIRHVKVAY